MNTQKILNSEISNLKIASLPSRPTAPTAFGGKGFTAQEMKEAFDKIPLLIIERFNALIDDIYSSGENSLASAISTGIAEGHSLASLFADITSGALAEILFVDGTSLSEHIIAINEKIGRYDNSLSNYPETVFTSSGSLTLEKAKIYRMGDMRNLVITIPEDIDDEFYCEITFDSREDATDFNTVGDIRFSGDDIADEMFYPKENTHYTVFLWYDGEMQGVVRGIPNA